MPCIANYDSTRTPRASDVLQAATRLLAQLIPVLCGFSFIQHPEMLGEAPVVLLAFRQVVRAPEDKEVLMPVDLPDDLDLQ
jgi:hypothetical protein